MVHGGEPQTPGGTWGAPGGRRPHPRDCPTVPTLSELDHRVESLLALGASTREIATTSFLSFEATRDHIAKIRTHHETCYGTTLSSRPVLVAHLTFVTAQEPTPSGGTES